jgi:hypothetical protein
MRFSNAATGNVENSPRATRREQLIRERLQVEAKQAQDRQTNCGGCRGRKITK